MWYIEGIEAAMESPHEWESFEVNNVTERLSVVLDDPLFHRMA